MGGLFPTRGRESGDFRVVGMAVPSDRTRVLPKAPPKNACDNCDIDRMTPGRLSRQPRSSAESASQSVASVKLSHRSG